MVYQHELGFHQKRLPWRPLKSGTDVAATPPKLKGKAEDMCV